jgi:hypothetical protein
MLLQILKYVAGIATILTGVASLFWPLKILGFTGLDVSGGRGFTLFSAWIVYREKSFVHSLIWVVLMLVLGFFTASLYAFIALYASKGDWKNFWMGRRADE